MDTSGKDFLHDNEFILWLLTGDQELGQYWKTFLDENPSLRDDFNKAITQFMKLKLNKERLTEHEYAVLKQRIQNSTSRLEKKKKIHRFVYYATAACFAGIIGFSIYNFSERQKEPEMTILEAKNIIVGENLDDKDICLITESTTSSFSNDVHVQVDKDGKTTIQEIKGGNSTVLEAGKKQMNKLVVPYGKRSQIELSDGTRVWINSGSVLEFPSVFTGETRSVNLVGEIYIEVSPDSKKPFYVNTQGFQVKVYGTKFNVSAYNDSGAQSVVLVEGSVSVKNQSKEETFLSPNDQLTHRGDLWDKQKVDITEYISWKDGYILLNHTSIVSVLKRMERYYNLSFDIQGDINLESKTCTGKIYLSENLDEVMETVSLLSSTKYTRKDKIIYIQY